MDERWSGGCQCGEVRYEIEAAAAAALYCCHCRDCQKQSASAFGMSLILPRAAFRLRQGALALWATRSDSGAPKRGHFCPTCGVRIFHDGGPESATISLKAGTLDDTTPLRPAAQIWTTRAQGWVVLPDDQLHYAGEPADEAEVAAAYAGRRDGRS